MIWLFWIVIVFSILTAQAEIRSADTLSPAPNSGLQLSMKSVEDDSDIKIAGKEPKPADEANKEAEELQRQKQNGNIDKARKLGTGLSQKIVNVDGDPSFGMDVAESGEIRMQRRILLAFAVCCTVEKQIGSKILQRVAVNEFYNSLKSTVPDFYADLGESGSFSFYYLCLRRGGKIERPVGRTFAMLAGKEGDRVVEELGEALFDHFTDVVQKAVKASGILQ